MASLADSLAASSKEYGCRAVRAYVEGCFPDLVLFAGLALEHGAMASLASINAAFLAPNTAKWFFEAKRFHAAVEDRSKLSLKAVSIKTEEALDRLRTLKPGSEAALAGTQELIAVRNIEVHLGTSSVLGRDGRQELAVMATALEWLLDVQDAEAFWAPHHGVVGAAVDERSDAISQAAARKWAEAVERYQAWLAATSANDQPALRERLERRRDSRADYVESIPYPCPVCDSPALAIGHAIDTDMDAEQDEDGIWNAWVEFTFHASDIECERCGLHLVGPEIAAAGLASSWTTEEIDEMAWFAGTIEHSIGS